MPHGSVGPVLLNLRQGNYTLLYARPLLEELVDVLNRPRIRVKYNLSDQEIHTVISLILLRGEAVTKIDPIRACRDPKDDKFLEVAVSGKADVIVSGDEDLLVMNPFAGIPNTDLNIIFVSICRGRNNYLSMFGEFHGIIDKLDQALIQTGWIGADL